MERVLTPIRRSRASLQDVMKEFMTATAAAKELGVTGTRVRRLCREGRFQGAIKLGTSWIIPRSSVRDHKRLPPGRKGKGRRERDQRASRRTFEEWVRQYMEGA